MIGSHQEQTGFSREILHSRGRSTPGNGESQVIEAIKMAQHGEAQGFQVLYEQHSRRVFALCRRMLHNQTEAEDLTQEAFFQAFRKIRNFRWESAFSTWLHRIAINVVLMYFRKKGGREVPLEEQTPAPRNDAAGSISPSFSDPSLNGVIDREILLRSIRQLPLRHRIVFVLHDVQGYTHQEIARLMRWSVGTSKGQLHKARTRLRVLLSA
jgi:RNA polymerase sigma-70 factor (ECF subfamily)